MLFVFIHLVSLRIKKHTGDRASTTGKCQVPPSVVKGQSPEPSIVYGEATPTLGTQAVRVLATPAYRETVI